MVWELVAMVAKSYMFMGAMPIVQSTTKAVAGARASAVSAPFGLGSVLVVLPMMNYFVDSYIIYAASVLAGGAILRSIMGAVAPPSPTRCTTVSGSTGRHPSRSYEIGLHAFSAHDASLWECAEDEMQVCVRGGGDDGADADATGP